MNANKIRGRMKEMGFNQGEVAEKIGMSQNSLSRKLCGKRDFSLSEMICLCEVLNIKNPQEIFFD